MPQATAGVDATPDETLLDLARDGDGPAREELFRRHFGIAYRVARRLLANDEDALDAVQDGFLKAVRHLGEFDGRSEFRTWLLRIVSNAAIDLGRRQRRRPTVALDDQPVSFSLTAAPEDPSKGLQRSDTRRAVDNALEHLTPKLRATFVLFAEAGLSYKEIAESQRIPIGTVMSRLNEARKKLQMHLVNWEI